MKRSRGRGRRPQNANVNHNNNNSGGGGGHNPNRTFDSNGPEIKIRGSAVNVYEKYLQLARDANASGDRVMAENYLQHAEHYFRILAAQQVQQQQYQQQNPQQYQNNANGNVANNNGNVANNNGNNGQYRGPNGTGDQPYVQPGTSTPAFSLNENGGNNDDSMESEGEEAGAE